MNESLFLFLNNFVGASPFFDAFVIFCAQYLIFILTIGTIIFVFKSRENILKKLLIIFGGVAIAWLISQGINELYPIARPFIVFSDIIPLFTHGGYDSFPSGHVTFAAALGTGVFYHNKILGWVFLFGALLIGISRVIAGVHWPADIIMGLILGVAIAFIAHTIWSSRRSL